MVHPIRTKGENIELKHKRHKVLIGFLRKSIFEANFKHQNKLRLIMKIEHKQFICKKKRMIYTEKPIIRLQNQMFQISKKKSERLIVILGNNIPDSIICQSYFF